MGDSALDPSPLIRKERLPVASGPLALIVSHSNFLANSAGTEKYILEQVGRLEQQGWRWLHLFPEVIHSFVDEKKATYGVNLGRRFLGYWPIKKIVRLLNRVGKEIELSFIQHLMYWKFVDYLPVACVLDRFAVPQIYFLHDFFSCCPGAFIPCYGQNQVICSLAAPTSSVLTSCVDKGYQDRLRLWRSRFGEVFSFADQIVAPSEFVRKTWGSIFPHFRDRAHVWGHLALQTRQARPRQPEVLRSETGRKVRLAFLGYKAEHKGWAAWCGLIADPRLRERYEFYHLGCGETYSPWVRCLTYSYRDGGPMAAVKALEDNAIDLAFLWSMVPESYSYTFHEALAAGVPVLTSKRSGNIAFAVQNSPTVNGVVFANEEELQLFLLDRRNVYSLLDIPREKYLLISNPYLGHARKEGQRELLPHAGMEKAA